MSPPEILVVANPLWEVTLLLDSLPNREWVQEHGVEVVREQAIEWREDTGGSSGNVGVHFSQWGFHVAHVGRVGTDQASVNVRKRMSHYGIEDALVEEEGRRLKTSAICRQNGAEEGFFCAWIPEKAVTPVEWDDIPEGWIYGAQWLHLDRVSELGLQLAQARHHAGKRTSLDLHICPNRPAAQQRLDALLPFVDLLQVSHSAMATLCQRSGADSTPEGLLRVLERAPHWTWVTLGEEGAHGSSGDSEFIHVPSRVMGIPVDSTGAGDSFMAAMIRHRLMGSDLENAMKQASDYAVETCMSLGALGAFPLKVRKESSGL